MEKAARNGNVTTAAAVRVVLTRPPRVSGRGRLIETAVPEPQSSALRPSAAACVPLKCFSGMSIGLPLSNPFRWSGEKKVVVIVNSYAV